MKKGNKLALLLLVTVIIALLTVTLCSCDILFSNGNKAKLTVECDDNYFAYTNSPLEDVKKHLTVKYIDEDGVETIVTDYVLSGTLVEGKSTLTVKYNGIETTCKITVKSTLQRPGSTPSSQEEYSVTFIANGMIVSVQIYTANNTDIVIPSIPEKTGYNASWENYELTTGDVEVHAVYVPKQYSITLNYAGAANVDGQQTITATYDEPVGTLPSPTKANSYFAGWYLGADKVTSETVWTIDENQLTFTAKWLEPTKDLRYELNANGTSYSVVGKGTATESDIIIPSTYDNMPVTNIGELAFSYYRDVTSVIVPNSVTSIGPRAFRSCEALSSITIPNSVQFIGGDAFNSCVSLKKVNYIGTIADWCNIDFDDGGETGFYGYSNPVSYGHNFYINDELVTDIDIPNTVTRIKNNAFFGFQCLESITIPNSVQGIGSRAFANCTKIKSVEIPGSVTSIGESAFEGCDDIREVLLNDGLVSIGKCAFRSCLSLTSIVIPRSVFSIGTTCFNGPTTVYCEAQSKSSNWHANWAYSPVVWDCNNNDKTSQGYAYAVIDGLRYSLKDNVATLVLQPSYLDSAIIPSKVMYKGEEYRVTTIDEYAFSGNTNLVNVKIPTSITSIGFRAFSGCTKLWVIKYDGLTSQFTSISKGAYWYDNVPAQRIECYNGNVFLSH